MNTFNFRTQQGIVWCAENEGKISFASTRERAQRGLLAPMLGCLGKPSYAVLARRVGPLEEPERMLYIANAQSYLEARIPFEITKAGWRFYVVFSPTQRAVWQLSVCAIRSDLSIAPIWVKGEANDVPELLEFLINLAVLYCMRQAYHMPGNPKLTTWQLLAIERSPKLALTDVLHLERY